MFHNKEEQMRKSTTEFLNQYDPNGPTQENGPSVKHFILVIIEK